MGTALWVLAAVAFVVLVVGSAMGRRVGGVGILSIFIGIGVLQLESGPYKRAIARGAIPEKWWPPHVGALGILLLVAVLLTFVAPTSLVP
jgi:hypothetical protein